MPPDRLADDQAEESSAAVRERVEQARDIQRERYQGQRIPCNARLDARTLNKYCGMKPDARALLMRACEKMNLSNRAYTRILKVARTIADLEKSEMIEVQHIAEAVQYRALDSKYWG